MKPIRFKVSKLLRDTEDCYLNLKMIRGKHYWKRETDLLSLITVETQPTISNKYNLLERLIAQRVVLEK